MERKLIPLTTPHLIREREVLAYVPLSRMTLRGMVKQGKFPAPIKLSEKCIAWPSNVIAKYLSDNGCTVDKSALTATVQR